MTVRTREEEQADAAKDNAFYRDTIAPRMARARQTTRPEDHRPPRGWRGLYVTLVGASKRTQRSISALSTDELAWLARTVTAELEARRS